MGQRPNWTEDELLYLEEKWGATSIKGIAKSLGRSIDAVKLKAGRIGLGDSRFHFDGITVFQLSEALNVSYSTVKIWIAKHGFPSKSKIFSSSSRVLVVTYRDFWDWAEKEKWRMDFARIEKGILGIEPDWVEVKRNADLMKKTKVSKSHNIDWTKDEDNLLKGMLSAHSYTYPQIARRLKRSEGAVRRRIMDLKLKARPVRLNNHIKYTDEDVEIIKSMYADGYSLEDIADRINKSALGVRGKLERMGYRFNNGVPTMTM